MEKIIKKTVLITGASAGLGEEFAWQLAAQNYNLLLVARRTDKLVSLQEKIKQRYPSLCCLIFSVDLNEPDVSEQLFDFINVQSIQLVGLINNAGFGAKGRFLELTAIRQQQMLQVNINALMMLSHYAIPLLVKEPDSFIINVASTAAFQAGPNLAVYYASKAFVLSFSEALHEELKGKIAVSVLCPGATRTEFSEVADMGNSLAFKLRVMEKQPVVAYALKHRDKAIVIPGAINKIGVFSVKLLPRFMARKLAYLLQK